MYGLCMHYVCTMYVLVCTMYAVHYACTMFSISMYNVCTMCALFYVLCKSYVCAM